MTITTLHESGSINITYCSNIDCREHILKHGGHKLHVHSLTGEAIKNYERRVLERTHHHILFSE